MFEVELRGSASRDFTGALDKDIKAAFAAAAREGREEFRERNARATGFRGDVTDVTDRRRGVPPEQAQLSGAPYIAEYEIVPALVRRGLQLLAELSPVLTGEYRRRHEAFLPGGVPFEPPYRMRVFNRPVLLANTAPYARRLEPEWGSPRLSDAAPQGIYWVAADILANEFEGAARIRVSFTSEIRADDAVDAVQLSGRRAGRRSAPRYPAIWLIPQDY